jgi:hypothetical protein
VGHVPDLMVRSASSRVSNHGHGGSGNDSTELKTR